MKALRILLLCLAVPFAAHVSLAQTQDAAGCKDSPLIARFPGSIIDSCDDKTDSTYTFHNIGPKSEDKTLEGEYHFIQYNLPPSASDPQVERNITTAFRNAGYTIEGGNCCFTVHMGKTWIDVEVGGGNYKLYTVIETTLTQDVVATAADLSNGITGSGHVVVNGILFDTAKADIKPESDPALAQVARLLKGNPSLKVYVVGHTDNVGVLAANIDLSKRRAAAVVLVLTTKYGQQVGQVLPGIGTVRDLSGAARILGAPFVST